jgi:GTPase
MDNDNKQKCTFIAIVGAPNAGKSTLLNYLVGTKVSIVSPKVQTTRTVINGIVTIDQVQLIFIDTPGIFSPKRTLERSMVRTAWSGIKGSDLLILIVDSRKGICNDTRNIINNLKKQQHKVILILNKTDLIAKEKLLPLSKEINELIDCERTFMISALKGDRVDDVRKYFVDNAPISPWVYSEDEVTTAASRFLASEITREKLFLNLNEELPYNLTVETDTWEELDNGSIKVNQTIIVARESHKKIILGKKGAKIKLIGTLAREELEELFDKKFHLFLFIKIRPNWFDNPANYNYMGMQLPN